MNGYIYSQDFDKEIYCKWDLEKSCLELTVSVSSKS